MVFLEVTSEQAHLFEPIPRRIAGRELKERGGKPDMKGIHERADLGIWPPGCMQAEASMAASMIRHRWVCEGRAGLTGNRMKKR